MLGSCLTTDSRVSETSSVQFVAQKLRHHLGGPTTTDGALALSLRDAFATLRLPVEFGSRRWIEEELRNELADSIQYRSCVEGRTLVEEKRVFLLGHR
jgi:hypothetical protein